MTTCAGPRCGASAEPVAVASRWARITFRAVDYPVCSKECAVEILRALAHQGFVSAAEPMLPYGAAS